MTKTHKLKSPNKSSHPSSLDQLLPLTLWSLYHPLLLLTFLLLLHVITILTHGHKSDQARLRPLLGLHFLSIDRESEVWPAVRLSMLPTPRRQWNYGYSSDDHAAFSNRVVFASQLPPSTGRVLPVHPSATLWRRFLCSRATQLHHAVLPVLLPEAPGSDGVIGIVSPRINGHGCWDWPVVFVVLNSEPSLVVELSFSFTPWGNYCEMKLM